MNLFELFVKVGVDDQASGALGSITEKLGNGLATAAKIGTAAIGAATAGIAALTKQAVENYAEYEQLVGGVETLFKESADTVKKYAEEAYQSAGLSTNEYMETVTSFSASLLQATGRGAQTNLEELESHLEAEYEATKEAYSKEYEARKDFLDKQYKELKSVQEAEIKAYTEAADAKIAEIDKSDKEAIAAAKQEKKNTLAIMKDGNKKVLAELKEANSKELKELKDSNTKKLTLQKAAIKDQVDAAEQANMVSETTLESQALAAELANQAIIDMADNANKMGTSMESIQNAYQGFAKANYTMLDNLNTMGALAA